MRRSGCKGTPSCSSADFRESRSGRVITANHDVRLQGKSSSPAGGTLAGHHPANQPFSSVARTAGAAPGSIRPTAIPGPARPITEKPWTFRLPPPTDPSSTSASLVASIGASCSPPFSRPAAACADDPPRWFDLQRVARAGALADHAHHRDPSASNVDELPRHSRGLGSMSRRQVCSTGAAQRRVEDEWLLLPRAGELQQ